MSQKKYDTIFVAFRKKSIDLKLSTLQKKIDYIILLGVK